MNNRRTMIERLLALALSLVLVVSLLPVGALKVSAAPGDDNFGTVTESDVLVIENNGSAEVSVGVLKGTTLTWDEDGWYVDMTVTVEANNTNNIDVTLEKPDGTEEDLSYSNKSLTVHALISEDDVTAGEDLVYTLSCSWWGSTKQTITLTIDLDNVNLVKDGQVVHFAPYGTVDPLDDDLAVNDGDIANVTVELDSAITLEKREANSMGGQEGWYLGIEVYAPVGYESGATIDITRPAKHTSGETSADVKFDENPDGTGKQTLWALITPELVAEGEIEYIWEFDWNADGSNDQTVTLTVDMSKVTLVDGEMQVWQEIYSTVESPDAQVSDEDIRNVVVELKDTELAWNPERGKWCITVHMTPPENMVVGDKNITYYFSDSEVMTGAYASNSEDGKYAIYELTFDENAKAGDIVTRSLTGEFDWDLNGVVDQIVTIKAANVELVKAEQAALEFNNEELPEKIAYSAGTTLDVSVSGGTTGGTVAYNSNNEAVATVDENGVLTIVGVGEVTITATMAGNDYYEAVSATHTLTVTKGSQSGFDFNATDADKNLVYAEGLTHTYTVTGVMTDATVEFAILADENSIIKNYQLSTTKDALTGETSYHITVTVGGVGSFTLGANVAGDELYEAAQQAEVTVTVVRGEQDMLKFNNEELPEKITYSEGATLDVSVSGGTTNGTVTYVSGDESVATVDENGVLTIHKAGTVTITATMAGNELYNDISVSYELTVEKAAQDGFGVDLESDSIELIYEPELSHTVTVLGFMTGWENVEASFVATENASATKGEDGIVTLSFKKAGTYTLWIVSKGDDCYETSNEVMLTITVNKAQQTIGFADTAPSVKLGTWEFQQSAAETSEHYGTGKITYTLDADPQKITYLFSSSDGSFGLKYGVGTVTIKATKAGDDNYEEAVAYYTLNVGAEETPEVPYTLDGTKGENGWYISAVTITAPTGYKISYSNDHNATWSDDVVYNTEGKNSPEIYLKKDGGGITSKITVEELWIDYTAPVSTISYSKDVWNQLVEMLSFGYYKGSVEVTITATDVKSDAATSGVYTICYRLHADDEWTLVQTDGKLVFTISEQYRDQVQYYAVDAASNPEAAKVGTTTLVVDDISPVLSVEYAFEQTEGDAGAAYYEYNSIFYTRYTTTVTLTITEANFDLAAGKVDDGRNVGGAPVVTLDGKEYTVQWTNTQNTDEWVAVVQIEGDADHVLNVEFMDNSQNKMESYTKQIHIDSEAPVIELEEKLNDLCTSENVTTTITIHEHNFDPSASMISVSAVDISGNSVDISNLVIGQWVNTLDEDGKPTDEWTAAVEFVDSGIYTLTVDSADLAGNVAQTPPRMLTVDHDKPENISISYSEEINFWEEILEGVTLGYYSYNPNVVVTLTAEDLTSGVDSFTWFYIRQDGSSETNVASKTDTISYTNGGKTAQVQFTLSAEEAEQFRGSVRVDVTDKAGNSSFKLDGTTVIIVDNIKPVLDITWSEAAHEVNDVHYYTGDATATIKINEANFYGEDVVICDNGVAVANSGWKQTGDVWETTVTLTAEGDHILTIEYTDRSDNKMESYTSEQITIDHTNPVVSVTPDNSTGRAYYAANTVVTVTVNEHNFDTDAVQFIISAVDVAGNAVSGQVEYGQWKSSGDIHTIELTFVGEGNYTLDVTCQDLAKRDSNDLAEQYLSVDKSVPSGMSISYSVDLFHDILSDITFGYYNAPVTVTLTAVDSTAGIDVFSYEYILNSNVSSVNKGGSGTVEVTQNGDVFTASFQIPGSELIATNQFNGYVTFTAVDRSGNSSTATDKGSNALVVDNIAPSATISYNEPVQNANGISYYGGNIDVTVDINEANFFSEDVVVTVTKDGVSYDVTVSWSDISVDEHKGTFTLTEEGDYVISVAYTDKSNNEMTTYTSNQLTLDKSVPSISVNNIVMNSANKDDVYSFTVTINDTNLDASALAPVLVVVSQDETGAYTKQEIDLGDAVTVTEGQTYTYTVENLTADGLYSLSCSAKDMAGNVLNTITLDDGQSYEAVQFSINRNGSTFAYGNEFTEDLAGQYYVYTVDQDVVIIEINVDPVETYSVKLGGTELTEGTDYTTTQTSNEGEWSVRTYTINKNLFAAEGEYNLVVSSVDKAGSTAYSDVKNLTVSFVVDQTAPSTTITGLEEGGRYQTTEQTVTLIPSDEGGRLDSLKIVVLNSNGEPLVNEETGENISLRFEMSGEELINYLNENDGKVTFTVPSGLNMQVQIICSDCAVDGDGKSNEYVQTISKVTVSDNQLVIFYANTPLFIGSIVGVLLLLLIIIILMKRKKDEKAKA